MDTKKTSSPCCQRDSKAVSSRATELFGITGFRTENKFQNHDEDASFVDDISDSPAVDEVCEIFFQCK